MTVETVINEVEHLSSSNQGAGAMVQFNNGELAYVYVMLPCGGKKVSFRKFKVSLEVLGIVHQATGEVIEKLKERGIDVS